MSQVDPQGSGDEAVQLVEIPAAGGSAAVPAIEPSEPPAELRERRQWVGWQYQKRGGKATKQPISPHTGALARVDDPATWASYEQARAAVERYGLAGAGLVFTADDPYAGVDLDGCRDPESGEIDAGAWAILRQLSSYTEASVSGTGVHCIVRGDLPAGGRRHGRVELYDRGRFFVVTGQRLADLPAGIEQRQEELEALHARVFEPKPAPSRAAVQFSDATDVGVLNRAFSSSRGHEIRRLWDGDISAYGDDHSRADQSLCAHLAYWTGGDLDRIDRLFRQSGLYREKWEREDYRQRTIERALR